MPERSVYVHRVDLTGPQATAYHELRDTLRLTIERLTDDEFSLHVKTYVSSLQRLQEIAAGFARNTDGDVVTFASSAKTNETLSILADEPGVPTIVWTWWRPELDGVVRELSRAGYSVCTLERDGRERFIAGAADVLVAQLASGGYGLNLERADRMIYHSLPWDLEIYLQSQDRNYRMTSTHAKTIYHVLANKTVDERVRTRLNEKAGTAKALSRSEALEMLR
jgi:SNF2 family DNA or RNA helicase